MRATEPMSPSKVVIAVLSGASSGIGLAVATLLACRGAVLSLADRNKAAMESLAQQIEVADRALPCRSHRCSEQLIGRQMDLGHYGDAWQTGRGGQLRGGPKAR